MKRIALLLIIVAALAPVAHACAVCYGPADDPMTKGVNNGIWVLLGVIGFVQLGFVALFWTLWKRAREQQRFREQFRVIHSDSVMGRPQV